ncbi:hypothetical protein [Chryseobacterium sp.]|uniref:hypothetical protein n=1 Tax=Chryseobacterium sp. TaxID=1871047 RepID=UPI0011C8FD99|nr:hypothetical protein [Chryseobacterium sp.]TXF75074.1 hypothetical protein FUA25_12425 [Chryseobacterium sp.]
MKRNITLFFAVLAFSFVFGQNKFDDYLNSKKLAFTYKKIKDREKEDYYQQYYWLVKAEELKTYPHLKNIKPIVLYHFTREIYPATPTKKLSEEEKNLRIDAEHSLNQYFAKKDLQNPNLMYNLESYVDPSNSKYYTGVNPERIAELVPKELYTFTSVNKRTKDEKKYYLWVDDEDYKIVDVIPAKTDKKFYETLNTQLPKYQISTFTPDVKKGDKTNKRDADYYFITPFQEGEEILYKTKDFKEFTIVRFKRPTKDWIELEKR